MFSEQYLSEAITFLHSNEAFSNNSKKVRWRSRNNALTCVSGMFVATFSCNMFMQHGHAKCSLQYGYAACSSSMDMQQRQAPWTYWKCKQHGHAPWACTMDMQPKHAARICSTLSFIEGELGETEHLVSMYELLQGSRYGWALKLGGRSSSRVGQRGTIGHPHQEPAECWYFFSNIIVQIKPFFR
jgi:hypothetical protein